MEANDAVQTIGRPDQSDNKSNDSAKSTEDDEVPFAILITALNCHTIDTVVVCCIQDQPNSVLPVYI